MPMSDEDQEKIMHVSLPISEHFTLMGGDVLEAMGGVKQGDNVSLSIVPSSEEDAKNLFAVLSSGGTITMELQKQFWNALFGMCTDKFGIRWMVNYSYE